MGLAAALVLETDGVVEDVAEDPPSAAEDWVVRVRVLLFLHHRSRPRLRLRSTLTLFHVYRSHSIHSCPPLPTRPTFIRLLLRRAGLWHADVFEEGGDGLVLPHRSPHCQTWEWNGWSGERSGSRGFVTKRRRRSLIF